MEQLTPEEELLLGDLREALRSAHHPRTALIVANARAAFGPARPWVCQAQPAHDPVQAEELIEPAQPAATAIVILECHAVTMKLEVRGHYVAGHLDPPGPATVIIENSNGTITDVQTDPLGRFVSPTSDLHGQVRLRVSRQEGSAIIEWTCGPPPPDCGASEKLR